MENLNVRNKIIDENFSRLKYLSLIATLISWKNYSRKIKVLTNSNKIEDLNCELSVIKEHLEEKVEKNTKELNITKEKLNILIAEDDEASEILLSIAVASFANKVFKTKTGCGAVDICRDNPEVDLVLMDIQMPKMNGYEATRQIRQFNKDVVIIAQTAFAMAGDKEKALEAGCNNYIAKPLNRAKLMEMLFRG